VLLAAIMVLIAVLVISALAGRPLAAGAYAPLVDQLRNTRWHDLAARIAGGVIGVLGLILLLIACRPGRPGVIPLAGGDPHVALGVTRAGLNRALASVAAEVEGADHVRVTARPHRITVHVRTPMREPGALAEQVRAAVTARIEELEPARTPRVIVRVRRAHD